MADRTGRSGLSSTRLVVLQVAACLGFALIAAVLLGAASPAMAQVKAPAKSKLKPAVKAPPAADPSDTMADQLNARWQNENGVSAVSLRQEEARPRTVSLQQPASSEWGDRLVSRATKYLGTPYRHGGISPATGFDCSGFVYYLYGAVFQQRIPRMPADMVREGVSVARSDLRRGDLVLFGSGSTFTHVGIYVGDGSFIHATHKGSPIQITPLDADYYRQRYVMAVRLAPP
ncbi:MAG: C40 family peptidase [Reyranellaceae bacterium]